MPIIESYHFSLLNLHPYSMEIHQKTPFFVHKKDFVLVKPAEPTPSEILSFSTIDNDPNLELLCQSIYVYQSNADSSNTIYYNLGTKICPQTDPALVIKEALSQVLVYYYPLAGKLKRQDDGKLRITCSGEGVPFFEATADCQLSSLHYFDGVDFDTSKKFVSDFPIDNTNGYHPLVLQVTKFSCGGFTIGMGLSHSVCDGFGAAQFFQAMAELASGKSEPTIKPVWERERLVGTASHDQIKFPVDKASLVTSPFLPTTNILHKFFNVDGETIRRIKMKLLSETGNEIPNESFTTIEILGAYVWRSKFRALKQNPNGNTIFFLAMGIRHLLNPPLPVGYYGNAFASSQVVLLGRDLNEGPLSKVAKMIKESKKIASNTDFIWDSINLLETFRQQSVKIEPNGSTMVLTDWRQLGLLEEVDFGWKKSVNMVPLPFNMFGYVDLCVFLPPCRRDSSMKGGVRILVSLPGAAMATFKEEMDALKVGV